MWTPLSAIRVWVRRQALAELLAFTNSTKKTLDKELQRLAEGWASDIYPIDENHARPAVDQEIEILDRAFRKPVVIGGHIDATDLVAGDKCRVKVLISLRDDDDKLTPLIDREYSGPMEDCISFEEQMVSGRVRILYSHVLGKPKTVFWRLYARK